jgi:imidazolonepropionase-like amidohydrolase
MLALSATGWWLSLAIAVGAAPPTLLIEGCSVFDPTSGEMLPKRTILVRGDRIVSVTGPGQAVDAPAGAVQIDGRGKFALPGLIDAHVHLMHVLDFANVSGDEVLPLYLAAGVTSVRSAGDEIVAASLIARLAAQRPDSCPRVFICSPVLDAEPRIHQDIGRSISEPAQVPAVIDEMKRWHITTVKIYAGTGRAVGHTIIDEAHRRGLVVTAHLGAYPAQEAVEDGIDCLEHITSVFDFIVPAQVSAEARHRGDINLNNPLFAALVEELLKHGTFVDPTLVVFRNMLLLSDVPHIRDLPDNALAPQRLRDFWPVYLHKNGCPQGGDIAHRQRIFAKYQELTGMLYRAGVPLLVGTDAPEPQVTPGFSLHQELELLVESGMTPAAALTAATLNNATALGQAAQLGSIAPEKLADIVLLQANPLDDIRHTRQIEMVIRGGAVCRSHDLLKLVPKE